MNTLALTKTLHELAKSLYLILTDQSSSFFALEYRLKWFSLKSKKTLIESSYLPGLLIITDSK